MESTINTINNNSNNESNNDSNNESKNESNSESNDEQNVAFDYQKSLKKQNGSFINKYIRVERYINRPLASLIVRAVFKTPVTPNGLTYFSFILGILSAFFFSRGTSMYFILGGVFIQLSSVVDSADGMLARSKDMCSRFGSHLDLFLDRIIDFSVIVGISVGLYASQQDIWLFFMGLLTAGLYLLQINLYYITNTYKQKTETGETGEARALLLIMLMIFSLAGWLTLFIQLLLLETVVVNSIRIIHFISLGRKRKEIGNR
jgi:phosphatidylglycerophosphate synthase